MTFETMEMMGINECDSNPLVTYADKLDVMDAWKAFVKYSRNMLSQSSIV